MLTDTIIETFNLTKDYFLKGKAKYIRALDNVNISIKKGEILDFWGQMVPERQRLFKF